MNHIGFFGTAMLAYNLVGRPRAQNRLKGRRFEP